MNIFDEINLPSASKYLISRMLQKRGRVDAIPGTNAYVAMFKGKEYIFLGEFTPLTPYMYGVVFSNQKYWFEILKELKIKFAWSPKKTQKKVVILMTKDGLYNAVLEKDVVIIGDGKNNVKTLVKMENIKRINEKAKHVMPIKVEKGTVDLGKILKKGEILKLGNNHDYQGVSEAVDKKLIKKIREVINFLPGLPFIRLEVFVKDFIKIDSFTFGKVLISPGTNIFFKIIDGKVEKDAGETLLLALL